MIQIDVDIFEPQGISKLDAHASFLSNDLASQLVKKSFSGKQVCGDGWGWWQAPGLLSLAQSLTECPGLASKPGRGYRLP